MNAPHMARPTDAAKRRTAYVQYLVIELDRLKRIVADLEASKRRLEGTSSRHAIRDTFRGMEGM